MSRDQLESFPLSAISQISWKKADVFDPSTYEADLEKADGVIHSLGIIFADPKYKDLINSSLTDDFPKFAKAAKDIFASKLPFGPMCSNSGNPLDKSPTAKSVDGDLFQKLNKESAVLLAKEFAKVKAAREGEESSKYPFVYISAEDHNKFAPEEYIESKRAAESLISDVHGLRSVFLRPGMMVDYSSQGNTLRDHLANVAALRNNIGKVFGIEKQLGASPILSVQTVAKAAVEALDDPTLSGPISLGALHKYATEFSE